MSIRDAGWWAFLHILDHESILCGEVYVTVDPKNTTQTSSACGFVRGTREWYPEAYPVRETGSEPVLPAAYTLSVT